MRNKAIIREINNREIKVEPLNSDSYDEKSCCSAGGCGSCGNNHKVKLMSVENPEDFTLRMGNLVEIEVSTFRVFAAAGRVLLMPFALFALLYFSLINGTDYGQSMALAAGFIGAAVAVLINLLPGKRKSQKEIPRIISVL